MNTQSGGTHLYDVTVNGTSYRIDDPMVQGRQLLSSAGFDPADEFGLIQLVDHETRSIGLDQEVDLRGGGVKAFRAFKTDRSFRFTLNERGCDWGAANISEPELRVIGGVNEAEILVLERSEELDKDLGPEDMVMLSGAGVEHIRTEKRLVTVFFKNKPYELPRGIYTTEELIAKFPIEPGYLLNLKTDDGELVTLKPGEHIRIKEGMHFYSQTPGGASS